MWGREGWIPGCFQAYTLALGVGDGRLVCPYDVSSDYHLERCSSWHRSTDGTCLSSFTCHQFFPSYSVKLLMTRVSSRSDVPLRHRCNSVNRVVLTMRSWLKHLSRLYLMVVISHSASGLPRRAPEG